MRKFQNEIGSITENIEFIEITDVGLIAANSGAAGGAVGKNQVNTLPRMCTTHAEVIGVSRGNFIPIFNLVRGAGIIDKSGIDHTQLYCLVYVSVVNLRASGGEGGVSTAGLEFEIGFLVFGVWMGFRNLDST